MPGSGWETLLSLGNSILQDKVLFGSTWLFMGQSIRQLADGVMELPLKEAVKANGTIKKAILGMDVKVDKIRRRHQLI